MPPQHVICGSCGLKPHVAAIFEAGLAMKPESVLLVYKKSLYQIYFLEKRTTKADQHFSEADMARYRQAHEAHLDALATVESVLRDAKVSFRKVYRARHVDASTYDFVVAVGGDGTLIEAARSVREQPLLGVNSDPARSHGHFCAATGADFAAVLDRVLRGTLKSRRFNRFSLQLGGEPLEMTVMNELLVSHRWPAAMTRYVLRLGDEQEEQRGSGIWVSTALGSSGSIRSAGGKLMAPGSRRRQYRPRELFRGSGIHYALTGGLVGADVELRIQSQMREGMLFLDGSHCRLPFGHGKELVVRNAELPLRLILTDTAKVYNPRRGKTGR